MAQSALDNILGYVRTTPSRQIGNVKTWANNLGFKPKQDKEISPLSPASMAENERQIKRQNYIRNGWTLTSMTPYEKQVSNLGKPVQNGYNKIRTAPIAEKALGVNNFPTPTPPSKSTNQKLNQDYVNFLENSVFPITRSYNIPDAVTASQWAMEGGRVTENSQNNPWGLMSGGKLIQYPSIDASTKDYALTVQNILNKKGYDLETIDAFNVLLALQQGESPRYEAHNPNPYTYVQNLITTPEWRYYYR